MSTQPDNRPISEPPPKGGGATNPPLQPPPGSGPMPAAGFFENALAVVKGKGKLSTNTILGAIAGVYALLQIPAIRDPVIKFGLHHPHVASTIGVVTFLGGLLHNPQVQAIIHYTPFEASLSKGE